MSQEINYGPSIYSNLVGYAHTEPDGSCHCHLCGWSRLVNSMEQAEFFINKHLLSHHGIKSLYREDDITGKITVIPNL